jgi:hypothetical protein
MPRLRVCAFESWYNKPHLKRNTLNQVISSYTQEGEAKFGSVLEDQNMDFASQAVSGISKYISQ